MAMAKPTPSFPPLWEKIASLMPITWPWPFTRGPPEFPGLMAASVWTMLTPFTTRSTALTMPEVTVWSSPNGLPTATAS